MSSGLRVFNEAKESQAFQQIGGPGPKSGLNNRLLQVAFHRTDVCVPHGQTAGEFAQGVHSAFKLFLNNRPGVPDGGDKLVHHWLKGLGKLFGSLHAGGFLHREQGRSGG
jgi:hypothetical protein